MGVSLPPWQLTVLLLLLLSSWQQWPSTMNMNTGDASWQLQEARCQPHAHQQQQQQ
jgi:hypothetical protein